jgi:hypothetical protein
MAITKTNRRGAKYALAVLFVFFVPGSFLSIFSSFRPIILPRSVVDLLFPLALFPVEKQLAAVMSNQLGHVNMDPEVFDHLSVFGQQVFVIALLCFFLILVILASQAWASAMYADTQKLPTFVSLFVGVTLIIVSIWSRSFFSYLLAANTHESSQLPSVVAVSNLLNAMAPECLIMFTCLMAVAVVRIVRSIYGLFLPDEMC